jgi:2-methylcitrate dehydratase PrpD
MMEAVDATVHLVGAHKIKAEDVVKVVARLPESGARTVNDRHMPDVNIQYILSSILLEGELTFDAAHDYGRLQNQRLLQLKEKVQLVADSELERSGKRFQGLVEITLKDGRTVREHVINCRGRPENPMSPEEVEKKAAWLMEPVLGAEDVNQLIRAIRQVESVPNIREITKLLMLS